MDHQISAYYLEFACISGIRTRSNEQLYILKRMQFKRRKTVQDYQVQAQDNYDIPWESQIGFPICRVSCFSLPSPSTHQHSPVAELH